jgi:hypothetical protein
MVLAAKIKKPGDTVSSVSVRANGTPEISTAFRAIFIMTQYKYLVK